MLGAGAYRADAFYPSVFDIERDPHEEWNLGLVRGWVFGPYLQVVGKYLATLKDHPNPPPFSMTELKK